MYFPSKKDAWAKLFFYSFILFIILIYSFGGEPIGLQLITYNSILGYVFTIAVIGLILWIWFGTGYYIKDEHLIIRFGPFKWKIKSKEIKKINKEKSPFTAPSLSIDRLTILYGNYKIISISPKNRREFIHLLTTINPNIVIEG